MTRPARIELHVGELVLHGFAPGDRYRIADAVQSELTRLLGERGLPEPLLHGGHFTAREAVFTPDRGEGPRSSGARIAAAVHASLAPAAGKKEGAP
jgi:hypothetical protein